MGGHRPGRALRARYVRRPEGPQAAVGGERGWAPEPLLSTNLSFLGRIEMFEKFRASQTPIFIEEVIETQRGAGL